MKIANSSIQLYSERTAVEQHIKRESLTVWQGAGEPRIVRDDGQKGSELDSVKEMADLLKDKISLSHQRGVRRRVVRPADAEIPEEQKMQADLNMRLLQALFERLTGRKFQVVDPAEFMASPTEGNTPVVPEPGSTVSSEAGAGYGLVYDYHESQYQSEQTKFASGGKILTTDGKEIDFSLNLNMSREFYQEQKVNVRAGDALKDPLVINFSGTVAQLSQRDFNFDIDADGSKDQIAFVSPGSGFLALDKNSDGVVNDGSELFGTLSGDGFLDLIAYDSDGNNWIDENDAIYEQLRIWSRTSDGQDKLVGLGKAGVGAIYLGHIETLFSVTDKENSLLGQVKSTGLAILENGQAVTVQQLDLVA